jgi:hypothetical protein
MPQQDFRVGLGCLVLEIPQRRRISRSSLLARLPRMTLRRPQPATDGQAEPEPASSDNRRIEQRHTAGTSRALSAKRKHHNGTTGIELLDDGLKESGWAGRTHCHM